MGIGEAFEFEKTGRIDPEPTNISLFIDGIQRTTCDEVLTGIEVRELVNPSVSEEYDLWLEVPGYDDLKIDNQRPVSLISGMRFYSVPKQI